MNCWLTAMEGSGSGVEGEGTWEEAYEFDGSSCSLWVLESIMLSLLLMVRAGWSAPCEHVSSDLNRRE